MEAKQLHIQSLRQRNVVGRKTKLFARIGKSYNKKNPIDNFKVVAQVSDKT